MDWKIAENCGSMRLPVLEGLARDFQRVGRRVRLCQAGEHGAECSGGFSFFFLGGGL